MPTTSVGDPSTPALGKSKETHDQGAAFRGYQASYHIYGDCVGIPALDRTRTEVHALLVVGREVGVNVTHRQLCRPMSGMRHKTIGYMPCSRQRCIHPAAVKTEPRSSIARQLWRGNTRSCASRLTALARMDSVVGPLKGIYAAMAKPLLRIAYHEVLVRRPLTYGGVLINPHSVSAISTGEGVIRKLRSKSRNIADVSYDSFCVSSCLDCGYRRGWVLA